jgi:predicted transcriptional regulator
MKLPEDRTTYFFVDESGDPIFFNKHGECIVGQEGCSKVLILGFIALDGPSSVRRQLALLRKSVVGDPYFAGIPSLARTAKAFHANDDVPEVRERVYRFIAGLDCRAEIVVARKILPLFRKRHHSNESDFYDDIVAKLFLNKLHLTRRNIIYFAKRGSRSRQRPLEEAIGKAVAAFETKWSTKVATEIKVLIQGPAEEPCLQLVDYVNWAIYRAFVRGEMRYFNLVRAKVRMVCDVYDTDRYPENFYTSRNPFDIKKISPL